MNLANFLTLIRILLVPVLINAIIFYERTDTVHRFFAAGVFTLACLTDAVDGYIARVFNQKTDLGKWLDPLADKLLLTSAFLAIYFQPHFVLKPPVWIIIAIVSRDVLIALGILTLALTSGKIHVAPNLLGKTTTLCQMLTAGFLLIEMPYVPIFWNITALLTILSALAYIIREGRRLREVTVP